MSPDDNISASDTVRNNQDVPPADGITRTGITRALTNTNTNIVHLWFLSGKKHKHFDVHLVINDVFLSLYLIPISHNLIITGHIISPSGYHTTFALWPRRTNATYENKTSHPKHQRWHKHGKKITSHTTNNPGYNTQGCGGGEQWIEKPAQHTLSARRMPGDWSCWSVRDPRSLPLRWWCSPRHNHAPTLTWDTCMCPRTSVLHVASFLPSNWDLATNVKMFAAGWSQKIPTLSFQTRSPARMQEDKHSWCWHSFKKTDAGARLAVFARPSGRQDGITHWLATKKCIPALARGRQSMMPRLQSQSLSPQKEGSETRHAQRGKKCSLAAYKVNGGSKSLS